MTDDRSQREQVLRRLPWLYSMALRVRDAGIPPEVICQFVDIEPTALDRLYRIAGVSFAAAQTALADRSDCSWPRSY